MLAGPQPEGRSDEQNAGKIHGFHGASFNQSARDDPTGPDGSDGAVTNADIAAVLEEIADLLDLREDNAFRVLAYRNAARELRSTGYDIPGLLAAGEPLPKMPGIGAELTSKIREIFETGTSQTLQKLRQEYSPGILKLLRLPGIGPKRVRLFYDKLGVASIEALEQAIRSGRLRTLGGFGAKSEQKILQAIETVKSRDARRS